MRGTSLMALAMASLLSNLALAVPAAPAIMPYSRYSGRRAKKSYPRLGSKLQRRLKRKHELGRFGSF